MTARHARSPAARRSHSGAGWYDRGREERTPRLPTNRRRSATSWLRRSRRVATDTSGLRFRCPRPMALPWQTRALLSAIAGPTSRNPLRQRTLTLLASWRDSKDASLVERLGGFLATRAPASSMQSKSVRGVRRIVRSGADLPRDEGLPKWRLCLTTRTTREARSADGSRTR